MYGICAIQINYWATRPDYIVYVCYMENGLGLFLFLAIMFNTMYIHEIRVELIIAGVPLIAGIVPVYYWITHATGGFNAICSPIIGAFYQVVCSNGGKYAFDVRNAVD